MSTQDWADLKLEELAVPTEIIDPARHQDAEFELWSVPAFPSGSPEILKGGEIGSIKQAVQPGDVLLCKINPRINRVWIVGPAQGRPQIASTEWVVLRHEAVEPEFLLYRLRATDFREKFCIDLSGIGGSLTRARPQVYREIVVTVPGRSEQKRIAGVLKSISTRVDAFRAILATIPAFVEQFRRSVLAAAFRGDLTAQWREKKVSVGLSPRLLEQVAPCRLIRRATLHERPFDLPALPPSWQWTTLGEIAEIAGGLTRHAAKRAGAQQTVPLVSVAAVQLRRIEPQHVGEIRLLPEDGDTGVLLRNDLLMVEGNGSLTHIGRAAIWDGSVPGARHQNHIIRIRSSELSSQYLLEWVSSPLGREFIIREATSAAGLYTLSLSKVARLPVPLPPAQEQAEIVRAIFDRLKVLSVLDGILSGTKSDLDELGSSTFSKAFRGELVPQDPDDEPASVLLERIRAERERNGAGKPARRGRRTKAGA